MTADYLYSEAADKLLASITKDTHKITVTDDRSGHEIDSDSDAQTLKEEVESMIAFLNDPGYAESNHDFEVDSVEENEELATVTVKILGSFRDDIEWEGGEMSATITAEELA